MAIPTGIHEIVIQVYVEEYTEGELRNQAVLLGLPEQLGSEQVSDDPTTSASSDSTLLRVLPLFVDLQYDTFALCNQTELVLDATTFGAEYLWQDGSSLPTYTATGPGNYSVTISNDCDVAIDQVVVIEQDVLLIPEDALQVDLGNSVLLEPIIFSNSDYSITWSDPLDHSLSCLECLSTMASPMQSVDYPYVVRSERTECAVAGVMRVEVNKNRDLYLPNVFSPDGNGGNDHWEIFSAQPVRIIELKIFSRWGEELTSIQSEAFGHSVKVWDGMFNEKRMQPGVFVWQGTFEFLDGFQIAKAGDLTLLR